MPSSRGGVHGSDNDVVGEYVGECRLAVLGVEEAKSIPASAKAASVGAKTVNGPARGGDQLCLGQGGDQ